MEVDNAKDNREDDMQVDGEEVDEEDDLDVDMVECVEHRAYYLSVRQQLHNILPFFTHYLVLSRKSDTDPSLADTKLLVPDGEVVTDNGSVRVKISDWCGADQSAFAYDLHPRRGPGLVAGTICARLQLAAIMSAAGCMLPDQGGLCNGKLPEADGL